MKKLKTRTAAVILGMALFITAGCGQAANSGEETVIKTESTQNAMGRYVESANEIADIFTRADDLVRMADGSLKVFDYNNGVFQSKDNGLTWEHEQTEWFDELGGKVYLMDVTISPDGYTGIIYDPREQTAEAEDNPKDGEEKAEEGSEEKTEEEGGLEVVDFSSHPIYMLISPDGTRKQLDIPYSGYDYIAGFYFAEDGSLFGCAVDGKVYEINRKDGSYTLFAELQKSAETMAGNEEIAIFANEDGLTIYDRKSKNEIEDKVLEEFITLTLGDQIDFNSPGSVPVKLLLEEDVLYMFCEKGIYRHATEGNMVEQVVDGALTTLSNPVYGIVGAFAEEDGSFVVLYTDSTLLRYTYNPDIPSVPDIQLKAYSLTDSDVLKMAISNYQSKNPEVYVRYETGMENGSSETREDALKKLNTEIMAGTGPDILMLDNLPMDSYVEKGVLADITPYLEDMIKEEKLLPNVVNAFKKENGIYAIPAEFEIPIIVAESATLAAISDLDTLTKTVEDKRAENPEGGIFGAIKERNLINSLIPVCVPAWKTEDNKIDEKALLEFYETAGKLWKAEKTGITVEMEEKYESVVTSLTSAGLDKAGAEDHAAGLVNQTFNYLLDTQQIAAGRLASDFDFSSVISVFHINGKEDSNFDLFKGQSGEVFLPKTIMGISAKTENKEAVGELLKMILEGEEMYYSSFPVNQAALQNVFVNQYTDSDDNLGQIAVETGEGKMISMQVRWLDKEQIARMNQLISQTKVPYIKDLVLENAVCEAGEKVLKGEISAEDGVSQVMKQTAIYLAE